MSKRVHCLFRTPGRKLGGLFVVLFLLVYAVGIRGRMTASYAGMSSSTEDAGLYIAKYYYIDNYNHALIRVYDSRDGKLLAERNFGYGDRINIFWTKNRMIYDLADESFFYDGSLRLPPTRLDRVLALLP